MLKYISKAIGIAGYVIQYGCITHCTFEYIGDFVVCSGPSMEPTLFSNNVLITDRISPRLNRISRGDIIIAKCPTNPKQHICKRVIALPGDRVIARSDSMISIIPTPFKKHVYKNSSTDEPKTPIATNKRSLKSQELPRNGDLVQIIKDEKIKSIERRVPLTEIVIPPGHVWLEGDNTQNSSDSRYYGPVPMGLIKSRAILRVWPIDQIKVLT